MSEAVGMDVPGMVGAGDAAAREAVEPADSGLVRAALNQDGRPFARRGFFDDGADKWLFVLFVIAGGAATLGAGSLGLTGIRAEVLPLGALAGYALLSFRLELFRLHPDRLGDNCYYMGFLLTLTSLSAALVSVQGQTGDGRGEMLEGLIGNFGVALFSTIGGIALRVLFMQMRREIEDVEQVVRNELQEAARALKDHLGEAVSDLESFRLRTQQVMEEQFESKLSGFAEASTMLAGHLAATGAAHVEATERLTEASRLAAMRLATAAEAMTAQVQSAGALQADMAKRLTKNADKVVGEMGRLVDRIDKVDVPSDLLTRQVEDVRGRVSALASALEAAAAADAGRQGAVEGAAATMDRLLARLADLPAFERIEASAVRLAPIIDGAGAAVARLGDRMAGQADAFGQMASRAADDATAMSDARRSLQADLAQSTAALGKLQGTLADVADGLVARLGPA